MEATISVADSMIAHHRGKGEFGVDVTVLSFKIWRRRDKFIDFSHKDTIVRESKKAFTEERGVEGTLERLQTIHRTSLVPGRSCVVFDEVQCFPVAREAIKQLVSYGKYHYIETGSL